MDWGQEHQIAAWIVDLAAAQCHAVLVLCEPEAVVQHEAEEALLGPDNSFAVDDPYGVAGATDSASMLASRIAGKRKGGFTDELFGIVVVLDLDAVVGMVADSARGVERVRAQSVLVPENRKPAIRTPQDLTSNAGAVVEAPVGLPSVHEPGLNLQFFSWKDLDAHSVKKPWRVRRNIRRLIGPVIEVVVAEEADVGDEDSSIHIDFHAGH